MVGRGRQLSYTRQQPAPNQFSGICEAIPRPSPSPPLVNVAHVEHDRRAQIINVANDLFREFGYRKTSVTDIGKAMGISTAYIYRFFKSKQAIGGAICATMLERLDTQLWEIVEQELPPARKFRLFMRTALTLNYELFVNEHQLNEVVVAAVEGAWCTSTGH